MSQTKAQLIEGSAASELTAAKTLLGAGSASAPSLAVTGDTNTGIYFPTADTIGFAEGGAEAMRIDSSGRVGIGTTTGSILSKVDVLAGTGGTIHEALCLVGGTNIVAGSGVRLRLSGNPENRFIRSAYIEAEMDGGNAHSLKFATNGPGVEPVERMRINAAGDLLINTTSVTFAQNKAWVSTNLSSNEGLIAQGYQATAGYFNRQGNDGTIVNLLQDGTSEGSISVSGTTVSYNGGHLARWSQLPNDEDPSALLKGTVMSNLDEMCEWGEEDNEQLNKTKVSDVEGDPNVAGVFVSMSSDETGPLDFFVGMTGDMIIRIAEGVTVQRGDLLMSAGDGTAKPQDDDIIRSKTIAKVTSTHVTCTYDDGSYCVPCVLMTC
jgi:hypothetical protein